MHTFNGAHAFALTLCRILCCCSWALCAELLPLGCAIYERDHGQSIVTCCLLMIRKWSIACNAVKLCRRVLL